MPFSRPPLPSSLPFLQPFLQSYQRLFQPSRFVLWISVFKRSLFGTRSRTPFTSPPPLLFFRLTPRLDMILQSCPKLSCLLEIAFGPPAWSLHDYFSNASVPPICSSIFFYEGSLSPKLSRLPSSAPVFLFFCEPTRRRLIFPPVLKQD